MRREGLREGVTEMLDTIETVQMPKVAAAVALKEYQGLIQGQLTKADQLAKKAYRELAKGRRIVNLLDAFRVTGVDELQRPNLAIARADWPKVFAESTWRGNRRDFCFGADGLHWAKDAGTIVIPRNILGGSTSTARLSAGVPIIPPRFRPEDKLSRYHILFQAAWEETPPVDPFLLRQLEWPMFVILAQWDLTPVERMIFGFNRDRA